jgi:hypothetical protein
MTLNTSIKTLIWALGCGYENTCLDKALGSLPSTPTQKNYYIHVSVCVPTRLKS